MAEGQQDDAGHSTLNSVTYIIFLSTIGILTLSIGQSTRDVIKFTTRCLKRVENIDLSKNFTISVNNNDNLSISFISELLRNIQLPNLSVFFPQHIVNPSCKYVFVSSITATH